MQDCIDDMSREMDSKQAEIDELKRQARRFCAGIEEHSPLTEEQRRHFWSYVEAED